MSGLAVVVDRMGGGVSNEIIAAVSAAIDHRGPDGVTVEVDGDTALIHAALRVTPEAEFERQPYRRDDGTWLVADARLDNRDELIEQLGLRRTHADGNGIPDIAVLSAAHGRWGADVGAHLIGDFAIVIRSPDGGVTCIRDQLGIKPLYHWSNRRWLVVASGLREISAHPDVPRIADTAMMGQYLSGWVEDSVATAVEGVQRLPAAHVLVLAPNGRTDTRRYWTPPTADPVEGADLPAYNEHFHHVFTDAVRCRLRTAGGVACELSGGLDSTSVAATAGMLVRTGTVPATGLRAYSCLFPDSPLSDERPFIDIAVSELDLDWEPVIGAPDRARWVDDDTRFWSDIPLPPDGPEHVALARSAARSGNRVVLTGHGGDNWFDASPVALAALIFARRPADAWRVARRWSDGDRLDAARLLARYGLGSFKPDWVRRPGIERASWVTGTARTAAGLDQRRIPGSIPRVHHNPIDHWHRRTAVDGYEAMMKEILDRIAACGGVEARHPYLDLRVVELACRAPITAHVNAVHDRALQRRGLRDLLPDPIADRETKASFNEVWFREIRRHMPGSPTSTEPGRIGWLDETSASEILDTTEERIRSGLGGGSLFALWGIVQVDALLRNFTRSGR